MDREMKMCVEILTGIHWNLRAHLYKMSLSDLKECRRCGKELEDSILILYNYSTLACFKYKIWDYIFP